MVQLGEKSHKGFGTATFVGLDVELEILFKSFGTGVQESFT